MSSSTASTRAKTYLAEAALPDMLKSYKKTKELVCQRDEAFLAKREAVEKVYAKVDPELLQLSEERKNNLPLDSAATLALLEGL